MTESATKKKAILADIDLMVYIGEQHVFVKVGPPDEEGQSNWPRIQAFYRWSAAEGLMPEEIWNEKLGFAVMPLRYFKALRQDFSLEVISKKKFFAE